MNETPEPETVAVPRVVRRKRWLVIGGGIAAVLVLAGVITIAVMMLTGSGEEEPGPAVDLDQLPLAIDQVPGDTSEVTPIHVGVEIAYANNSELGIEIRSAKRTTDRTTIEFYEPQSREVDFLVLQLLDAEGSVLKEVDFTVPTSFIVEFGTLQGGQTVPAGEGTLYLVLPVPTTDRQVTAVRVVSKDHSEELDRVDVTISLSQAEGWQTLLGQDAQAQAATDNVFRILVINEVGAESLTALAVQQAQAMGNSIRPWDTLMTEGRVEVIGALNNQSLGCTLESISGRAETFPVCRDQARVFQIANSLRPDWDTIIVPMNASCGSCGTAYLGSNVVALGNQPLAYTIAHELGHSIAHLRDEYGYSVPGYQPQPGPPINCFPSQAACQEVVSLYASRPGAACAAGCEQVGQWRPATAIMHSFGAPQHGPLEEDHVRNAVLGRIVVPPPTPTPLPPPSPAVTVVPPPSPAARDSVEAGDGENVGVLVKLTTERETGITGTGNRLAITMEIGPTNNSYADIQRVEFVDENVNLRGIEPGSPHYLLQVGSPVGDEVLLPPGYQIAMPTAIGQPTARGGTIVRVVVPKPEITARIVRVVLPTTGQVLDQMTFSDARGGARLTIEEVEFTHGRLTTDLYTPKEGESHSLLQLYGPDGVRVVAEIPFRLPTEGIGEGADQDLVALPAEVTTAYLVVPRPTEGISEVRLVAPSNRAILDRRQFSVPAQNISPNRISRENNVGKSLKRWWQSLTSSVWAAGTFDILVMNEVGAEGNLNQAVAATVQMTKLDPWSAFAGQVKVTGKINTVPLGCLVISLGAGTYPQCSDAGKITQVANSLLPDWDAIVIVTSVGTQSGTVFAPRITAVGANPPAFLILHEFGHAVGRMVDEYGYKHQNFPVRGGINCFDSLEECQVALEPFAGQPGAQCSSGCSQLGEWRPATRIMHNTYTPLRFGPLERCIMYNSIAAALGEEGEEGCDSLPPEQSEQSAQFYWGWRR